MRFNARARALSWLVERPIAHRGLHDAAKGIVENSASAFAGAVASDYAIECDLRLTGDSEAVVFHDATVDRLMEGRGQVKAFTAAELKHISFRGGRDRIQTLHELLDQVSGRVPLVIEIKSDWDGGDRLAARALAVLESYGGPHALMSFDPDAIEAVRQHSPRTVRGIVMDRTTDRYYDFLPLARRIELRHLAHLPRTLPHFLSCYHHDLPFAPVTACRDAGLPVITWTLRSQEDACRALRYSDQITFEGFAPRC